MKTNVHSTIDLITNSSTEIYTWATKNSVKTVKEIIDAVLDSAGSDKTADDLFDIKVVVSKEHIENKMHRYLDENKLDWRNQGHKQIAEAAVLTEVYQPNYEAENEYDRPGYGTELSITPKTGVELNVNLASKLERIFEQDAYYG